MLFYMTWRFENKEENVLDQFLVKESAEDAVIVCLDSPKMIKRLIKRQ